MTETTYMRRLREIQQRQREALAIWIAFLCWLPALIMLAFP